MSRVEELPDDFDEILKIDDLAADSPSLEDLYSQHLGQNGLQATQLGSKSFEETMLEFSQTPLFMNSLDVAGDADGQNDALEAIRALQYEGTKAEIAQGFKERGNEMVKEKSWSDAKEFYTKGIAVLTDKSEGAWEEGKDPDMESKKRQELEEQIYTNRALCNLELKNYRSTTLDCAAALRVNASNIKAHYRSATALLALDKILEARDICSRGQRIDPSNSALLKLSQQIDARAKVKDEQSRKAKIERFRIAKEKATLAAALKARKIRIRGSEKPPELEDAVIRLSPDPLSPKSLLEFPTLFLYPMHHQSDFVKAFAEKDAIVDHLSYLLPLPWDAKKEYRIDSVDCFMDTTSGGLAKMGKKVSLLEALTSGNTEIVDGLVRIHVLPRLLAPRWIEEVRKKKGK